METTAKAILSTPLTVAMPRCRQRSLELRRSSGLLGDAETVLNAGAGTGSYVLRNLLV
jgi:hypothetical protein